MSDPFLGEIRMFAGTFAPRGWAFCDGQLLAVSQNNALFSLFGTIYGGDGRNSFGLPDLRGRVPIHAGAGPGLSPRQIGSSSGVERVTLTPNQLPAHRHPIQASSAAALENSPAGNVTGESPSAAIYSEAAPEVNLDGGSISAVGGSQPHTNLMPSLCVNFIVALAGIFPSRN
jgi:microcystin-dependent protein